MQGGHRSTCWAKSRCPGDQSAGPRTVDYRDRVLQTRHHKCRVAANRDMIVHFVIGIVPRLIRPPRPPAGSSTALSRSPIPEPPAPYARLAAGAGAAEAQGGLMFRPSPCPKNRVRYTQRKADSEAGWPTASHSKSPLEHVAIADKQWRRCSWTALGALFLRTVAPLSTVGASKALKSATTNLRRPRG